MSENLENLLLECVFKPTVYYKQIFSNKIENIADSKL